MVLARCSDAFAVCRPSFREIVACLAVLRRAYAAGDISELEGQVSQAPTPWLVAGFLTIAGEHIEPLRRLGGVSAESGWTACLANRSPKHRGIKRWSFVTLPASCCFSQ